MEFANPEVLWALLLVPILVLTFILAERKRKRILASMVVIQKPHMVMGPSFERRLLTMSAILVAVIFIVIAAARPLWGSKMEEVQARGIDILIAVDVSQSMLAEDVSPSRLDMAKLNVRKLMDLIEGDRVGLIAFAGSAYTFCPMTVDYGAVNLFLSSLEPGVITDGGTNIPAVIQEAMANFERNPSPAHKVLVIFSDGENHETDPLPVAEQAAQKDIQIFTVGVGNPGKTGARIPIIDESGKDDFKKDRQGNLVITRLEEETLQALAETGNGDYYRLSGSGNQLVNIYRAVSEAQEAEFSSKTYRQKEDRYQIPLALALAAFVFAYSLGRRSLKRLRRTQGVSA